MDIDLKNKKPDVRSLDEMRQVIYDKEWLKTAPNLELYYMYRGLEEKNGLRYDITIMPPKMLGQEFVKTAGHYHIGHYQEVYIVLEGKAIYLMQKQKDNKIKDVYCIKAEKGDVVIIPAYYGHITINPAGKELKMGNWISKECKSDYQPIFKKQGACYYYTINGWIKNKNYRQVPELRFEQPLKEMPRDLSFLK